MRRLIPIAPVALVTATLLAQPLSDTYRDAADKLIDAALSDQEGYRKLSYLCDRIGNRLSGSIGLDKAIVWAAEQMRSDGLKNVVTPRVKV
ncbi:MAG: peptidase M28 family protein, partial [Acidobacteriota bacterium]|nr:peptidase M28 family protein [Acidobacteriota bacterium]